LENAPAPEQANKENEKKAIQRARERARIARWDLNIAIFLFAVLIIILILLFQGITINIVAPIAVVGLALVWLTGWRQGRQLYERFLEEELSKLEFERSRKMEESIEEAVQRALRERWR
jgi:fatty acid desaturase